MVIIHKVYIQFCFCAIVTGTANRNEVFSFICKIAIALILWLYLSLCLSSSYNLLRGFWGWPPSLNPYLKPTLHHHFFWSERGSTISSCGTDRIPRDNQMHKLLPIIPKNRLWGRTLPGAHTVWGYKSTGLFYCISWWKTLLPCLWVAWFALWQNNKAVIPDNKPPDGITSIIC